MLPTPFAEFASLAPGGPAAAPRASLPLPAFAAPPNIATAYTDWAAWAAARKAAFQAKCPAARSTTYYFAQAGNDNTGDGSQGNPWKTLAKAQAVLDASGGNVALLFNRGDVWRESAGLATNGRPNVTVGAYGTGAKPSLRITQVIAGTWVNAAGNRWTISPGFDCSWLIETNDLYGETRGTHLIRLAASATVESTSNSWWYDSATGTLHVNLGGTDPNTVALEGVVSNQLSGVMVADDGGRIDSIHTIGWGCSRTITATQAEGIRTTVGGTACAYVYNCESYYGGSHTMAHYSGGVGGSVTSGGRVYFDSCTTGYTKFNGASGETVFNSYATNGGQESWFDSCVCQYGTLKSSDWSYATLVRRGTAYYGHTVGVTPVSLGVVLNCTAEAGTCPASIFGAVADAPAPAGDIAAARSFVVGGTKKSTGVTGDDQAFYNSGGVTYGFKGYYRPRAANPFSICNVTFTDHWLVNCYLEVDLTAMGTNLFGFFNVNSTNTTPYFWHTTVRMTNNTTSAQLGMEYNLVYNTTTSTSVPNLRNGQFVNSVLSYANVNTNATHGTRCAFHNIAARQYSNGYRNTANAGANQRRDRDQDPGAVLITTDPTLGTQINALQAGSTSLGVSHDINGKARNMVTPWIGPEDYS